MKARLSPNLISFVLVRRGDWLLKVSVYKSKTILVIAHHIIDLDRVVVRFFIDQNVAADFIENLVED
jgi:hypothetical protein